MNDEIKSMLNNLEKLSRGNHFFLNEDKTYRVCTLMEWARQLETIDKHVAEDYVNDCRISTVWLGLNHSYDNGPPLVFETMVFDSSNPGRDVYLDRYSTWEQAEAGHKIAIEWVKNGCKEDEI